MPRIPDTERIIRLLETEGGSLGRREIIEGLGLSDDRYEEVAYQLVSQQLVVKNRGRAGGLRLRLAEPGQPEAVPAPVAEEAAAEAGLERDLYPAFTRYLLGAAAQGDESKSLVLETYRTKLGKWETPDLAEVRVTPFPTVGQWELRVVVYELKRQGGWGVESVHQASTYKDFAHESWLVVPSGAEDDWVEHFGKRVVEQAANHGVGIGTFDAETVTFKKHTSPERRQAPSLSRQQEWLESVIERLGQTRLKEVIAGNIRWARAKAESGRD